MKISDKLLLTAFVFLLQTVIVRAQIGGIINENRITDWHNSGLQYEIPQHHIDSSVDINSFFNPDSDGTFFNDAFARALRFLSGSEKYLVYFPEGEYHFNAPLQVPDGIVLKGDGSDRTKLFFDFGDEKANCINVTGAGGDEVFVDQPITAGENEIIISGADGIFTVGGLIEIKQGENEGGETHLPKEYLKGQIFEIENVSGDVVKTKKNIRLGYDLFNQWNKPLKAVPLNPVENAGIEDLFITRTTQPASSGGALVNFGIAYNCWLSGVELFMGANNVVMIGRSKNIEIRGCYLHEAYNYGAGGNGYGVSIGGSSTDCLVENNIFESLRHSMILSQSANGNVFGYNASVNKPDGNWDESSLNCHGHYPYLNLFEGNYAEFAEIDFVWGENGPFNTYFRNYIYHEGYFLGTMHNQQIEIEDGNNGANVVANLAKVSPAGEDNFIAANFRFEDIPEDSTYEEISYYKNEKPDFIDGNLSWPCFGLKPNTGAVVLNDIPAMERLNDDKKTVSAKPLIVGVENIEIVPTAFKLYQNYPNPFSKGAGGNSSTTIKYTISNSFSILHSQLSIYDVLGRKVATLINEDQMPGNYSVEFNAGNLPSGIYFYKLTIRSNARYFSDAKKMLIVK
ncbi:MAG: T9SS type A sorting domain-containing protein [Chlorobi bacterium]|nr:T9SS type A sorting domain-containing protein [Chlorobiota bacterium]